MIKFFICFISFICVSLYADAARASNDEEIVIVPEFFLPINSLGTYLFTDNIIGWLDGDGNPHPDVRVAPTTFNFLYPMYDVNPGDVVRIKLSGTFTTGIDTAPGTIAAGVFRDINGNFLFPNKKRTTASPMQTPPTCTQGIPTDIPQDFFLPNGAYVDVQIPKKATSIAFTFPDCYFADNIFSPSFGTYLSIVVIRSKYKLEKKVYDKGVELGSVKKERIVPKGVYTGSDSPNIVRRIRVRCLDNEDKVVGDCRLNASLVLKEGVENNGGHVHTDPGRPLGKLSLSESFTKEEESLQGYIIPEDGLNIYYQSPEVAGVVSLNITGTDKDGKKIAAELDEDNKIDFEVRVKEDLIPINILGLDTILSLPAHQNLLESHPGEGHYLTIESHNKMQKITDYYFQSAADPDADPDFVPVNLRTLAGSLSWGGRYDIKKNWKGSHLSHRRGIEIDLSMKYFNGLDSQAKIDRSKKALANAILIYTLKAPYYGKESPEELKADHWHLKLENIK